MDKIHNRVLRVTDALFLSSLPTKGLYDQQVSVTTMVQRGVTMVVTAVEDDELDRSACLEYLGFLVKAGINVVHCPVPDMKTPSVEDSRQVTDLVRREITRGGRVAFQCYQGLGRSPCLLSAYLVSTGVSPAAAVKLVRQAQPHSFLTIDQLRFPIGISEACLGRHPRAGSRSHGSA